MIVVEQMSENRQAGLAPGIRLGAGRGCIGLYDEHIEEVSDRTTVETQVNLI